MLAIFKVQFQKQLFANINARELVVMRFFAWRIHVTCGVYKCIVGNRENIQQLFNELWARSSYLAQKREKRKKVKQRRRVGTPYLNLCGFSTKGCRLTVENMTLHINTQVNGSLINEWMIIYAIWSKCLFYFSICVAFEMIYMYTAVDDRNILHFPGFLK